jgi:16S rRNA (guanine966-N2)-methyltransferase
MRIIAGTARGSRIQAPAGRSTRPITDRAKESIFNMVASRGGVDEAVVLDLFAGSGSFGLESLSRGARSATFVERDRRALTVLRSNIERLGFEDRSTVVAGSVETVLSGLGPADIAFCDPPYAADPWIELQAGIDADLLVGHAESPIQLTERWTEIRRRVYGRSHIVIARRSS